jgi:hypothetical protein
MLFVKVRHHGDQRPIPCSGRTRLIGRAMTRHVEVNDKAHGEKGERDHRWASRSRILEHKMPIMLDASRGWHGVLHGLAQSLDNQSKPCSLPSRRTTVIIYEAAVARLAAEEIGHQRHEVAAGRADPRRGCRTRRSVRDADTHQERTRILAKHLPENYHSHLDPAPTAPAPTDPSRRGEGGHQAAAPPPHPGVALVMTPANASLLIYSWQPLRHLSGSSDGARHAGMSQRLIQVVRSACRLGLAPTFLSGQPVPHASGGGSRHRRGSVFVGGCRVHHYFGSTVAQHTAMAEDGVRPLFVFLFYTAAWFAVEQRAIRNASSWSMPEVRAPAANRKTTT